jgi:glycine/D-amino acid oxidase-like deaminating enzyme
MTTECFDVIVIGAGVVGASVAFHLARLGAGSVLVLERNAIGTGTTSQSSGILRTHYSVRENVDLALRSWDVFRDFAAYVEDPEASCGLVKCGYMIAAPDGALRSALDASVAAQRGMGIAVDILDREAAARRLPIARFDDAALIAYEPEAGFADPYLVTQAFAKAARRRGVTFREGVGVERLVLDRRRVIGVDTDRGRIASDTVVSAQNIWSAELTNSLGMAMPVKPERHAVLALEAPAAYTHAMPVFKDLASPGMLYCRSYGGTQMLVSEGSAGETLATPDIEQGPVSLDVVGAIGAQVAERFPAYESAGLAASWTGVYDVTPDWNPVLGRLPGIEGLVVGFGFSGHGFKLSPVVGRVLAQEALGLATDVALAPYSVKRFNSGDLLVGRYGSGAVS